MNNLLELFSTDRGLLDSRGSLIIRQLCLNLNTERIYRTFAEILEKEEDLEFASVMVQKLNMILMHHIRATLPDIKARISQQLQKYNQELTALGGPLADGNNGNVVLSVITEFTSEFRTVIDGGGNDLSLNALSGGARISFVFHELFNNGIKSIDPFDQVKDGDIRTILYNSSVRLLFLLGCGA